MKLQERQYGEPVAIIGDIHGQVEMLRALLEQIGSRPVLVTGDVGDRGPDTKGVIDLLVQRKAAGVLGNHDEWLRDYAIGGKFDNYSLSPVMGGQATLTSYDIEGRNSSLIESQYRKIPKAHRVWLQSLPIVLDLTVMGDKYWLTHAGVPPAASQYGLPPHQVLRHLATLPTSMTMWHAYPPQHMSPMDRPVIMGHIVQPVPFDSGHMIAIDTGAGFPGRKLTALLLPERTFIQVA